MSKKEEEKIIKWLEEIAKALGLPPADWEPLEPKSLETLGLGLGRRRKSPKSFVFNHLHTKPQNRSEIGVDNPLRVGYNARMKKFCISIMEVYEVVHSVEAETKEEAIRLALDGADDDPYMEYSHTLEVDKDLCIEVK